MLEKIFPLSLILMFLFTVTVMPHGDEKNEKKPVKVSTGMQMDMEEGHVHSDSLEQAEENEAIEKDFAQIREDVENSTVPTVIKAISLAAFIAGLAFLYIPRKKKENNNG